MKASLHASGKRHVGLTSEYGWPFFKKQRQCDPLFETGRPPTIRTTAAIGRARLRRGAHLSGSYQGWCDDGDDRSAIANGS
jgi:hypothetical protein